MSQGIAVTQRPLALVGKTGADLAQLPDQLLNRAHPVQESVIESQHKREPMQGVDGGQETHNLWHFGRRSLHEVPTSATRSHLELLVGVTIPCRPAQLRAILSHGFEALACD